MPPAKSKVPQSFMGRVWTGLTTAQAIVISTAFALTVTTMLLMVEVGRHKPPLMPAGTGVEYLPNPQGGIWVRTGGDLYLCRAVADAPGQCFSMATETQTTYTELGLH